MRAAVFALQQIRDVNVELDQLRRFALIAAGLAQERFKSIARGRVIFFLQRHQREIELGLPEFRIDLQRFLKFHFGLIELFLLEQNLAAQIQGRSLVWLCRVGFVDKFPSRRKIALLISLASLLNPRTSERLAFRRPFGSRRQLQRRARLAGLLLQPANFVKRFGKKFVERRRKILFRL